MPARFRLLALALLVLAPPALAQRVVLLEFEGDKGGKLRTQVEKACRKEGKIELLELDDYVAIAAKKKLKGAAAMSAAGVARVSKSLKLDAAVEGTYADNAFDVRILDRKGQELWSKSLKAKKGLLSEDFAKKLARAIAAAAAPQEGTDTEGGGGEEGESEPRAEKPPKDTGPAETMPGLDLSEGTKDTRGREAQADSRPSAPAERDQDLENESARKKGPKVGPKLVTFWVAGTTTWRTYCATPGVNSCAEFLAIPEAMQPSGDPVDFTSKIPYAGFNLQAEVFPLALLDLNRFVQGIGFVGSFGLGFSLTNVTVKVGNATSEPKQVVSTDYAWSAQAAYRVHFAFSDSKNAGVGFVGIRGGVEARRFDVDANAQVPLPGANRLYGVIGLDLRIPIVRFFNVDGLFSFPIGPRAGPDETAGYGSVTHPTGGVVSRGLVLGGGVSGDIWGPLGYRLQVRWTSYKDQFYGDPAAPPGKWRRCDMTQCGGAAEESYVTLTWGVTAAF